MKKLIQNYIHKITENDVEMFAIKNNVPLSKEEVSILYFYIKNEYETLLYGDSTFLFSDLKRKVRPETYEKVISLFKIYKKKYGHYL